MRRSRLVTGLLATALLVGCSNDEVRTPSPSRSPIAMTTAGGGVPFPPVGAAVDERLAGRLGAEVQRWVGEGYLPGLTVAVVTRGRTWSGAAGVDGKGSPLLPTSGLAIASITKTFVAAEVLTLAEEGLVDLDAAASTYVRSPLLSRGVTVRQLLEMRSGLPQQPSWDAYAASTSKRWTAAEALAVVPTAVAKPGLDGHYNNVNYWVLGLVVESVRKAPLEDVLERDLFEPAGLERLTLQTDAALPPPLGQPLDDEPAMPMPAENDGFLPFRALASAAGAAGGIAADAPTVARWGYELYGGRVLEKESLEEMTDFGDDFYGLGTMDLSQLRWNVDAVGHAGETLGYRSALAVFPESQLAVAILTPSTADPGALVQYLVKAGGLLARP